MTEILPAIYFILPAYMANMMPVIGAKLKLPFDKAISKKYLGDHKTYRGFLLGYIGAFLVLILQIFLDKNVLEGIDALLNYSEVNPFIFAFPFGVGALVGDAIKSFFKRRFGKKPGSSWPPFDQIDFVLGTYFFLIPFFVVPLKSLLILLIITPILHLSANVIAYKLGLKEVWW